MEALVEAIAAREAASTALESEIKLRSDEEIDADAAAHDGSAASPRRHTDL